MATLGSHVDAMRSLADSFSGLFANSRIGRPVLDAMNGAMNTLRSGGNIHTVIGNLENTLAQARLDAQVPPPVFPPNTAARPQPTTTPPRGSRAEMLTSYLNEPHDPVAAQAEPEVAEATFLSVKDILCDKTHPSPERAIWIAKWAAKADKLPQPEQRQRALNHIQEARMTLDDAEKLSVVQPIISHLSGKTRQGFLDMMAANVVNMPAQKRPFGFVAMAEKIQDNLDPPLREKPAQTLINSAEANMPWIRQQMGLDSPDGRKAAVEAIKEGTYDPRSRLPPLMLLYMPGRRT